MGKRENGSTLQKELSDAAMSVLFSNLAKGAEKQYKQQEKELFDQLSEYYRQKAGEAEGKELSDISEMLDKDIGRYADAMDTAKSAKDRGALRALVWGEKVAKIQSSVLKRYDKLGSKLLEDTNIYVCDICGFVYIGDEAPDICPVCKVPRLKISKVGR